MKRGAENHITSIAFSLLSAGVFKGDRSLRQVLEIGVDAVINGVYDDIRYAVFCAYTDAEVETLKDIFEVKKLVQVRVSLLYIPIYSSFNILCYSFMVHCFNEALT